MPWDHVSRDALQAVGYKERQGRAEMERKLAAKKNKMQQQQRKKNIQSVHIFRKFWGPLYISYDVRMRRNESQNYTTPRGERNGEDGSSKLQATLAVRGSEHGPLN